MCKLDINNIKKAQDSLVRIPDEAAKLFHGLKKMAEYSDTRVNLAALRRVDPYATEILETGTQVAVYKYSSASNQWEKTEVEGTLFLYNRSGDPHHGFVVMNRLSTENFVEPVTKDMEIQLQTPFLLYRNAKGGITGIWFYEENECKRLAQRLEVFIKGETSRHSQTQQNREPAAGVDILSLLSKAQGEFEQKHGKTADVATSSSDLPVQRQELTNGLSNAKPLSVADIFGTGTVQNVPENNQPGVSIIDKLLSSVVPSQPLPPSAELQTAHNLERELREKLKIGTPTRSEKAASHSTPLAKTPAAAQHFGAVNINRRTPEFDSVQTLAFTPPKTSSTLPLMSPMMFAAAPESREEPVVTHVPARTALARPVPLSTETPAEEVTPLTKAQLIQAFNHLLKNDPGFITRLHEAYVDSLKQSLKMGH